MTTENALESPSVVGVVIVTVPPAAVGVAVTGLPFTL
jgi:hypothetical protein